MRGREGHAAWVCVDCYETHHGVREEWRPAPDREPLRLIPEDAEVTAGLLEHAEDCPNSPEWIGAECDCERDEFSWAPCDGCGSTLGGAREALTVWELPAPTVVVFRMWRNTRECGTAPIALFPLEEWDRSGAMCASYEHLGQHGGADYAGVIARTRPATTFEYLPLARELEGLGYRLDIRRRRPARNGS